MHTCALHLHKCSFACDRGAYARAWSSTDMSDSHLCSHVKLHSRDRKTLEWRVLVLTHEAPLTWAEDAHTQNCIRANGALHVSASALRSCKWSFMCAHLPISPTVQFRTDHGPVVGHSPGVGDPWSKTNSCSLFFILFRLRTLSICCCYHYFISFWRLFFFPKVNLVFFCLILRNLHKKLASLNSEISSVKNTR